MDPGGNETHNKLCKGLRKKSGRLSSQQNVHSKLRREVSRGFSRPLTGDLKVGVWAEASTKRGG